MTLGPATEQLLRDTFAERALVPANAAARVLDVDEKTFAELVASGAVRHVLISAKTKRFAEHDLRAFLVGETRLPAPKPKPPKTREPAPCRSTNRSDRHTGTTTSSGVVVGFTDRLAKRRAEQRKPSKPGSGGRRA